MEDDRPAAEQPAADVEPPTSTTPPAPTSPAPTPPAPPPATGPVVSWGPPSGTAAPVSWAVLDKPRLPPPSGTVYAGTGIRFVALLLDLVPLITLGVILIGPVFGDMYQTLVDALPDRIRPGQTSFPELQEALSETMAVAIPGLTRASALFQLGSLFYLAGTWLAFGRTPGMALLGLRIVREEDGGRLGLARVAVRYGGYLLSAIPLLLGFAWAIFDNRNQAWHDKLAGTVVVKRDPYAAVAAPAVSAPPSADGDPPALDEPIYKRPSIGGVAELALRTFRRAPLDFMASLAIVLIPAMIVLLPLIALYLIAAQDQAVVSLRLIGDAFNIGTDPASFAALAEYNRKILASTAPLVLTGALTAIFGSIVGSLFIGACAAAIDDARSVRPAGAVSKALVARLPALLILGVTAGILLAIEVLLVGFPSLSAASTDPSTFDPNRATLAAVLGTVVLLPVSIYLMAVWLLALVCVVREGLRAPAAMRRAWHLSRGRMRWLVGISIAAGLGANAILGPIGFIPLSLFAEDYFAGGRLPAALSVVIFALLALLAAPVIGLTYVEAYLAARAEAAAGPAG